MRENIVPFGCGVMARLCIQTTGFGVSLWQSINDLSGHLANTQLHRQTIKNLFLNGLEHTLFSESKLMRDENACFPVY